MQAEIITTSINNSGIVSNEWIKISIFFFMLFVLTFFLLMRRIQRCKRIDQLEKRLEVLLKYIENSKRNIGIKDVKK